MAEWKTMYESLRLSSGGGLRGFTERVEPQENTATIVIGIGGAGIDALRKTKEKVDETIKTYDVYDRRIQFLAIDSDESDLQDLFVGGFHTEEVFSIRSYDLHHELRDIAFLESIEHLDWFNKEIEVYSDINAGGIRQVGKYLLSKKARELYEAFRRMIYNVWGGRKLNVCIMAGLSGGTGGGCFIDVCYLMRQALEDSGYASNAKLSGLFILPEVSLAKVPFQQGESGIRRIKKNGYAALKELDYLMDIPNNRDEYRQVYHNGFEVVQRISPVDFCYLVSETNVNGTVMDNGYDYAMETVAEYVLQLIERESAFELPHMGALRKEHGVNYVYNIIGNAYITVPNQKNAMCKTIKFFDLMKDTRDSRPTRDEVEKFLARVGCQLPQLEKAMTEEMPELHLDAQNIDRYTLRNTHIGEVTSELRQYCERWLEECRYRRKANLEMLGKGLDSLCELENPKSIIERIFKELIQITKDPRKGPYFATHLIKGLQGSSLCGILTGMLGEVLERREYAHSEIAHLHDEMCRAQDDFRRNLLFATGKRKDYLLAIEKYYKNFAAIELYGDLLQLIERILYQVNGLCFDYFEKYTRFVTTLICTFEDNEAHLSQIDGWNAGDEQEIVDTNALVMEFNSMMLRNSEKWLEESENQIAELVSDFVREHLCDGLKSMKQQFEECYREYHAPLYMSIGHDAIKRGLYDRSTPLFPVNPEYPIENGDSHWEINVQVVPDDEPDFEQAAMYADMVYNLNMQIHRTKVKDEMSAQRIFSGIPLYAYGKLEEYESIYEQEPEAGLHLFEGENRDWRKLPSPVPATYIASHPWEAGEAYANAHELLRVYVLAMEKGIIVEDEAHRQAIIRKTQPIDTQTERTLAEWQLEKERFETQKVDFTVLEVEQNFAVAIRDEFVRKPIIVEVVKEEMRKYDVIRKAMREAEIQ